LKRAQDETDERTRSRYVLELGGFPLTEVEEHLKKFLQDESKWVRIAAAKALVDAESID